MEHEIRFYLAQTKVMMKPYTEDEQADASHNANCHVDDVIPARTVFAPQYLITAVKLPTGAVELAVNNKNIEEKIDYILEAYDSEMRLKTNHDIVMENIMIV